MRHHGECCDDDEDVSDERDGGVNGYREAPWHFGSELTANCLRVSCSTQGLMKTKFVWM